MPNWCNNHVEISHADPAMISRVIKSFVTGKMLNMGFGIVAYYYEPGMQFAGIWDNGGDEYYKGWGNAAGAEETLPLELDELFNISRDQERWEEDEEDQ